MSFVCISQPPQVQDIYGINRKVGQKLIIKAKTKDLVTKEEMRDFWALTKESTTDSWGSQSTARVGIVEPKTGTR